MPFRPLVDHHISTSQEASLLFTWNRLANTPGRNPSRLPSSPARAKRCGSALVFPGVVPLRSPAIQQAQVRTNRARLALFAAKQHSPAPNCWIGKLNCNWQLKASYWFGVACNIQRGRVHSVCMQLDHSRCRTATKMATWSFATNLPDSIPVMFCTSRHIGQSQTDHASSWVSPGISQVSARAHESVGATLLLFDPLAMEAHCRRQHRVWFTHHQEFVSARCERPFKVSAHETLPHTIVSPLPSVADPFTRRGPKVQRTVSPRDQEAVAGGSLCTTKCRTNTCELLRTVHSIRSAAGASRFSSSRRI